MNRKLYFSLILIVSVIIASCGPKNDMVDGKLSTDVIDPKNPPIIQFRDTTFNFGTISEGQVVSFTYFFKNIGKSSLVIQDVHPSCGCTVPKDWPKHPIKPGEEGKIDVTFDSNGKQGHVTKSIRVVANTKPPVNIIRIEGTINGPETDGKSE